jgi:hypothetical protein
VIASAGLRATRASLDGVELPHDGREGEVRVVCEVDSDSELEVTFA